MPLRDGHSDREDFAPETGGKLSQADVADLLRENAEGSSWEVMGETSVATSYIRKDGKAAAQAARPNTNGDGNVKLGANGVELIIKYTAAHLND